jgi:putative transposase
MSITTQSTAKSSAAQPGRRRPSGPRTRVRPRSRVSGRPRGSRAEPGWLARRLERRLAEKLRRRDRRSLVALRGGTLSLFSKAEVEDLARETGFYRRKPRAIGAFDFALCTTLGATAEGKRGFASVWRLLAAASGVEVARSAVTQRFGPGSARLMEGLFQLALKRLPETPVPDMLTKLDEFSAVLAHDGSVLTLSPVLQKLFPATRTNSVQAAGKLHATADLLRRRIVRVELTGERDSELAVARAEPIEPGTLHIDDLGYTSYDRFAEIKDGQAALLMRLKDNANPTIVAVRHGVHAPVQVVRDGVGLRQVSFTKSHDTFDVDAAFKTKNGSVVLRVVGCYNPETDKHHCYVTTLSAEDWTPQELATLYSRRWVIELLFKLLKSSCHLDHLDTSDPNALRTHIYASLLAATILSSLSQAAAHVHGIPLAAISSLAVGIAAPLLVIPLMYLWRRQRQTPEEMADAILRVLAIGCRDQNPRRTKAKWGGLRRAQRAASSQSQ